MSNNDAGTRVQSPAYRDYLSRLRWEKRLVHVWQFLLVGGFILLWEIAPRSGWVEPMLTSYPSAIAATFRSLFFDHNLLAHTGATALSTAIGFVGSMTIGIVVAVTLWLSNFLYKVVDPFIVVLNALPKIALVPIYYIWLGPLTSIYAMAITVSVFITIIMLYTGFRGIDPDKIKLARLFGASKWQVLTKIILPGSVPTMISVLKVNIGLSLVGVVVGEFQSAKIGLGHLIIYGSQIFQMNLVMVAIVILGILSIILFWAVQLLERYINRRRGVVS